MRCRCANVDLCRRVSRDFEVGDEAPVANQDVRQFPDWYKPYRVNYYEDGYLLMFLGMFALFGYSYLADIKQAKGRKTRFAYESDCQSEFEKQRSTLWSQRQLAKGDPNFTKFLEPKQRAAVHHH